MIKDDRHNYSSAVAIWLFIGVGMLILQVLLGGITRLTGSGLSITEWNVVTGVLPPMNESQWIAEFEKYRHTDQFRYLNFEFTLSNFKFIFFWEWLHRLWGRLIGFAFAIPFVIFLIQRRLKTEMVKPLIILFFLGGLQALVGWVMVLSGLTGDAIYVAPTKLAVHFILALALVCYSFWFALQLSIPAEKKIYNSSLNKFTWLIIVLLVMQLIFGSLMAGHKAAPAAYTWPDINGSFVPPNMFAGGLINLITNKITIHFVHRNLGYFIFILMLVWTVKAYHIKSPTFDNIKWIPMILVLLQVTLGILSVVSSNEIIPNHWGRFEWFAQFHQLVAMFLLLSLVLMLFLVRKSTKQTAS
jgi:heme a synthase